jgi:hypothetical protein
LRLELKRVFPLPVVLIFCYGQENKLKITQNNNGNNSKLALFSFLFFIIKFKVFFLNKENVSGWSRNRVILQFFRKLNKKQLCSNTVFFYSKKTLKLVLQFFKFILFEKTHFKCFSIIFFFVFQIKK